MRVSAFIIIGILLRKTVLPKRLSPITKPSLLMKITLWRMPELPIITIGSGFSAFCPRRNVFRRRLPRQPKPSNSMKNFQMPTHHWVLPQSAEITIGQKARRNVAALSNSIRKIRPRTFGIRFSFLWKDGSKKDSNTPAAALNSIRFQRSISIISVGVCISLAVIIFFSSESPV